MGKNKAVANAAWIISCRIVQALLNLVVNMLSARYLGPSNYGLISYAASVVAFVVPVMQLGLRSTLVQEIIDRPEQEGRVLGTSLVLTGISSLACIVGVFSFSVIANPGEPVTWYVCGLYSLSLLFQAAEMIQYWFQAKLISKYISLTSLGAYVAVSAYKIWLLVTQKSVLWFAVSNSIDFFLIAATLLLFYRRLSPQRLVFSPELVKALLRKSRFFIISGLMVNIFAQTDRLMLKAMLDERAVGIYSAAVTAAGMTSFLFAAIIDSVRPTVFEGSKISKEVCERRIVTCYSIIIYLSLTQSVVFTLLSSLIIRILFGADYADSAAVLRIVTWYTTFSYMGPIRNIWMLLENKQNYLWRVNLIGAGSNVVLNLALIPFWGVMGAAVASVITQFVTNFLIGYVLKEIRYNNTLLIRGLSPKPALRALRSALRQFTGRLKHGPQ